MFDVTRNRQTVELLPMFMAVPTRTTAITGAITPSDTEIEVEDVAVLPPAPNIATLSGKNPMPGGRTIPESVFYEKTVGNTLTGCVRGYGSTAAMPHEAGTEIERVLTSQEHNNLIENIERLRLAIVGM